MESNYHYILIILYHSTYVALHHEVRLHAVQAIIIEAGFKANQIINNFIHWKLKQNQNNSKWVMNIPEKNYQQNDCCPSLPPQTGSILI